MGTSDENREATQVIEIGVDNDPTTQVITKLMDDELESIEGVVKATLFGGRRAVTVDAFPFASSSEDKSSEFGAERSRVLSVDDFEALAQGEYIPALANPAIWTLTAEQNTRLNRCIRTFARNTVGLGYELTFRNDEIENDLAQKKEAMAQMDKARELFDSPNDDMPFTLLMEMMKIDEETIGNGWIEIVRNRGKEVTQIHHAPGSTIRWKSDLSGYIQIRNRKKRYFKVFGDDSQIDARTGKLFEGAVDPRYTATELMQFKIYSPRSTFYGVPRYIACAPAIAGNRFAALRNVTFFENDAVPRLLITVNGGKLDPDSLDSLREFFERHHKGVQNAHRVAILQPEPKQQMLGQQSNPVIRVVPLTVGNGEDGSFLRYSQATNEEIREAFGLSESFFQSASINRACLVGDTKIPLLAGYSRTMKELSQEYGPDDVFWVYSMDRNGQVVPGRAHSPRKTKTAETWELLLDSGDTIEGTADHLFMLLDGSYRELASLKPGDRLMPLYRSIRPLGVRMGVRTTPYWWYSSRGMKKTEPVHRMVGRHLNGGQQVPSTIDVHHTRVSLDNQPDSLELVSRARHGVYNMEARFAAMSVEERKQYTAPAVAACTRYFDLNEIKVEAKNHKHWKYLAAALGTTEQTLLKKLEIWGIDPTEFRHTYFSKPGGRHRDDVTLTRVLDEATRHRTLPKTAKALKCSMTRITSVLVRAGMTWKQVRKEMMTQVSSSPVNHRVIAVRKTGIADVYDITVDEHHNFALHTGVFVHNSAEVGSEMTNKQELDPDRVRIEHLINHKLLWGRSSLGYTLIKFRFKRLAMTTDMEKAQVDAVLGAAGALSPNEIRQNHGRPPFPDEFLFAKKPLAIALAELKLGIAMAIAGTALPIPVAAPGGQPGQPEKPGKPMKTSPQTQPDRQRQAVTQVRAATAEAQKVLAGINLHMPELDEEIRKLDRIHQAHELTDAMEAGNG